MSSLAEDLGLCGIFFFFSRGLDTASTVFYKFSSEANKPFHNFSDARNEDSEMQTLAGSF